MALKQNWKKTIWRYQNQVDTDFAAPGAASAAAAASGATAIFYGNEFYER